LATGTDLKVERIRAGLTMKTLAARMGTSRQTLHLIERSELVPSKWEAAYRAALTAPDDKEGDPR
jgi:DNA-binding XRE family transcriptional regulator